MKSLSIRTKFIIAFMAVGLLAIALVGIFTSTVSNQEFQDLVLDRIKSDFSAIVTSYYEANGTLLGIDRVVHTNLSISTSPNGKTTQTGLILTLPNGGILIGDPTHPTGTFLNDFDMQKGQPD